MDTQMIKPRRLWYGVAVFVLVAGCLAAAIVIVVRLATYPALIADAYAGPQQKIEVPGVVELDLTREGAYGVYYEGHEGAYIHAEWPPRLNCHLTAKETGDDVPLVPDYVPGNRYSTADGRVGVLIYSMTIEEPGRYTLSCKDPLGAGGTTHRLKIGPNYVFEFLRVAWHLGGSLLGALAIFCASMLLSSLIATVTFVRRRRERRVAGSWRDWSV